MTRPLRNIILALAAATVLAFSGCDQVYSKAPATQQVLAEDSVRLGDGSFVALSAIDAKLRNQIPAQFITRAGTVVEIDSGDYVVRPEISTAVGVARALPIPYADAVGAVLSSVLGIGALWLNKKRTRAERINQSVIKGVDDFRDLLDQTTTGKVLDAHLTKALSTRQSELNVATQVADLLKRYQSPTKPAATQVDAQILAALQEAGVVTP